MGTTAEHVHDFGAPVAGFRVDWGSLRGSLWKLLGFLCWPSAVTFRSARQWGPKRGKHHVVRHNRVLRRLNHAVRHQYLVVRHQGHVVRHHNRGGGVGWGWGVQKIPPLPPLTSIGRRTGAEHQSCVNSHLGSHICMQVCFKISARESLPSSSKG